ncbi:response regulator [Paenibacillus humicola]|uniref:response regulator n=1 Tax=Paenibacillus humicola TaxID=3110540 RepID=UPI00237C0E6E|nr:response regulator transcription factor [Paenibacillus humicola]
MIADDHPHGREGIRDILERDASFEIVGEAEDGEQAVRLAAALAPDLILMDIRMPNVNGMAATARIKAADPQVKIVMVTVSDDIADLFEAIKHGAQGYLPKNVSPSAWLEYLRAVAVDETPMPKELAFRLLQEFTAGRTETKRRSDEAGAPLRRGSGPAAGAQRPGGIDASAKAQEIDASGRTPLTPREREILERVAQGESNRQIAETLGISEHTVKNHLKSILQKLHLDNRVQLTRYAFERGWMDR